MKKIPLSNTGYAERLERELSTFEAAGLGHYLLLVRECVELFRREGACVGPRGSVGGSLVAYCLGLAELDPVKHDLPWERFYAPGRRGWPDVDIDLDDEFREKVPEILRRRFGEDNVAQISTYGTFGVRQAIRDAARAYGIVVDEPTEDWDRDDSQGGIEDVPAGRQLAERSPKAAEFAKLLIGRVRQFGLHPGGFVIQATPITETRGAIVNRKIPALCWDMEATEKLGFVKLDFLGNSSLRVLKAISQIPSVKWDSIDLDDKVILQDFASGRTAGVPQFGTAGIRVFVEMLRPQNFKELVWANAAFRPGGLGTMGPRELVAAYRRDPDSVLVYQEDVMDLCVGLAGFSWTDADAVRKAIAKSQGQEALEEWREKFVTGCAQTGSLGRKDAESLWTTICNGFPRYAFPKAHAAAYAWNAYRVAWAKRYHAVYAFAALLNADPDSAEQLIDEAEEFGVEILPPHVDRSGLEWQVEEGKLRAPLTRLPNADLRVAKAILLRREKGGEFRTEEQLRARCKTVKIPEEVYAYGFGRSEIQFQSAVEDPQTQGVRDLARKIRECDQCDFRANCRAPVPPEWGRTNILIVGEAPGWKEDRYGKPFVGDSGQLLTSILEESGISREDVTWTNVVKCRPVGVPPGDEGWAENCPWITEEIAQLQPPLALAVGRHAWHRLGGEGGILKANATVRSGLPVVVACVHPAAVLRDPSLLPEMERALRKFSRIYKICLKSRCGA